MGDKKEERYLGRECCGRVLSVVTVPEKSALVHVLGLGRGRVLRGEARGSARRGTMPSKTGSW